MNSMSTPALRPSASVKTGGNRWKFVIGGLLILAAIAYATISSFQANTLYYLTLNELYAQRTAHLGQSVRINAPLDKSSIRFDDKSLTLTFILREGDLSLPVVYKGVVPDTLESGESIVAEGKLGADGVFQASTILVKCPSKYESATPQAGK